MSASKSMMLLHRSTPITLSTVRAAAERIGPYCHNTPVVTSTMLDSQVKKKLFYKCELLQKTGAFKFRGATNAVLSLKELQKDGEKKDIVLVTHSSGNHGQAMALAGKMHGFKSVVVVPNDAPPSKISAIRGYGAEVVLCEPTPEARIGTCQQLVDEFGDAGEFLPSADHPFNASAAGTLSLEMLEKIPDLDALVISIGGGGLLSGISFAAKQLKPSIKVYAAEPLLANDLALSFAAGERTLLTGDLPKTVADGLRMNVGELSWEIIRKHVDDVITVSEDEIIDSMLSLWQRLKMTIEASAAVSQAAVVQQSDGLLRDHKRIGLVLCGGNVDLKSLPWQKRD